ncbi:MAG TPA: RHS repeat-associated core domain-containing protein [Bryobacteraceae bacterium]|jgi:RHS repeat-associated protein|nr:RHS repeat-associated core domain-containing protein [Bryobacteraceae bacterium]
MRRAHQRKLLQWVLPATVWGGVLITKGLLLFFIPMSLLLGGTLSSCDINQDGKTDVADVQRIVNEALGAISPTPDVNSDGAVNVVDIAVVIHAAVGGGCLNQPVPTVLDFSPRSGPAGTLVSLTGSLLVAADGTPVDVRLTAQSGGVISAPETTVSATSLSFIVPPGAATGPLQLFGSGATTSSAVTFTVTPSSSFTLSAAPPSASVIVGQTVTYTVTLASTNGFSNLAQLAVSGVPAGVTASFKPAQVTVGEQSVLTLTVPSNQPTGQSTLTLSATATVDGIPIAINGTATVNILPITTSFVGRTVVSDNTETSLANVKVTMLGSNGSGGTTPCSASTFSDASGNFTLTNLPAGCVGPQLVGFDGTTVSSPSGMYAGVNIIYTLTSGQVTASPVLVHLPRIDNAETFMVQQNSNSVQNYSYSSIPGLSLTVYPGTTFTMPDGTQPNPFPLTAVRVPVDRLPDLKPPVPTMINIFIVAFQPANVTANQPVAVYYPNPLQTAPGTSMPLLTLDPTKGSMVPYGTGVVSADGVTIVPDFDPNSQGHRYGIVHFDWHGPMPPPPSQVFVGGGGIDAGMDSDLPPLTLKRVKSLPPIHDVVTPRSVTVGAGKRPKTGGSVDLASGLEVFRTTDLAIPGNLGSVAVERTYRSMSTTPGPFGLGTSYLFAIRLDSNQPLNSALVNLIASDGSPFPFSVQPDGTLTCTGIFSMTGAVMRPKSDGTTTLTLKDQTVYTFAPAGSMGSVLASVTDADGNTTTIQHDPADAARITAITDTVGRSLTLTYDTSDRILRVSDPLGRHVDYAYNAAGYLQTVTNPMSGVWKYTYDAQGNLATVTDPRNTMTYQNQYTNGRVSQQTFADGSSVKFGYILANPLVPTGPVLSTIVTDQLGRQTTYRWNAQGYMVGVTDPMGQQRTFTRDPQTNRILSISGAGRCPECGDPELGAVSFTYNADGSLKTQTDGMNNTYSYTYDGAGNVKTITDPLNHPVSYTWDSHGHLLTATDANNNTSVNTYYSNGLLKTTADPSGATYSYQYSPQGDLIGQTDPMNAVTQFRYNAVSHPIATVDAAGNQLSIALDSLDRMTSETIGRQDSHAEDRTLSLTYSPIGSLLSVTDNAQHTVSFTYDAMGRTATHTDAAQHTSTYTYTPTGQVQTVTGRDQNAVSYAYDALDRVTQITYPDATVVLTYDAFGRLKTTTDSQSGVFNSFWDDSGSLIRTETPVGAMVLTRDANGRVVTRQVVGQPLQTFTFDPAGNLLSSSNPQGSVSYTYDQRSLPLQMTRSNNVNTTFAFDAEGKLVATTTRNGSTPLNAQAYAYDISGRLLSATSDIAQSLTTQSATATYDSANRILTHGSTSYTHDVNGNRLTESGGRTYTWDGRGRLSSFLTADGRTVTLTYDPAGNLIRFHQTGNGTDLTRSYVLEPNGDLAYQDSNDPTQRFSFLTGVDTDTHYAAIDSAGNVHFSIEGATNSTVASAGAAGTIEGKAFYEPYGQTTTQGFVFPTAFTGRTTVDSNLYYLRSRFYDAMTGRFISEDTTGLLGGANLYEYAGNDPVGFSDPSGQYNGVDDATALLSGMVAGAVWEVGWELLQNPGHQINWRKVGAAALGGAVGVWATEYLGPVGAAALGSAITNALDQHIDVQENQQCGFSFTMLIKNAIAGAAAGAVAPLAEAGAHALGGNSGADRALTYPWLRRALDKRSNETQVNWGQQVTKQGIGQVPNLQSNGGGCK